MNLYRLTASNWENFHGTMANPIQRDDMVCIAQTEFCDAFLYLSSTTWDNENLELQDSVPSDYTFTYNQSWGLETNQTKIDRVIAELS
jgi:hypothetical protein